MTTRKAVVSYPVDATRGEKRHLLVEGITSVAAELIEYGLPIGDLVHELEQVANDAEQGQLV
jgi:hypothetical protein